MKKHSSLNACQYVESAWQKVQNDHPEPALLAYYKFKSVVIKNDAIQEAQQKFLETPQETRCEQLHGKPNAQLAQEYLILATVTYDTACQRRNYQPEPNIRGSHIHKIAENLARIDRTRAGKCPTVKYPFDGIEQCYYLGRRSGFGSNLSNMFLPCGAKPDLIDTENGQIYDFKTGSTGTDRRRHNKNVRHVPQSKTGVVSSHDVTLQGVRLKYCS